MDPEPYFEITRTVFDLPVDMQNFLYYFEKKKNANFNEILQF